MRRTLLHLVRATSTLLCIAALIMWHRSYRISDGFAAQRADGSVREIVSYAGGLHIRQVNPQFSLVPITPVHLKIKDPVPANANWQNRAGAFTNQVLWERAGFVLLASHTQTLALTGSSGYGSLGVSGTLTTSNRSGNVSTTYLTSGNYNTISITSGTLLGNWPANTAVFTTGAIPASPVLQFNSTQLLLVIPWWFIATLTALLPAAALARAPIAIRNHLRHKRNLCTHCGYDLRESAGRCPECGHHRDHE